MRGLSLVVASGGHSSSRCAGFSLSWPLLLRVTGSRRAGSVVVAHGPSCSAACEIFPDQGSNPCPLHWQADSARFNHCATREALQYFSSVADSLFRDVSFHHHNLIIPGKKNKSNSSFFFPQIPGQLIHNYGVQMRTFSLGLYQEQLMWVSLITEAPPSPGEKQVSASLWCPEKCGELTGTLTEITSTAILCLRKSMMSQDHQSCDCNVMTLTRLLQKLCNKYLSTALTFDPPNPKSSDRERQYHMISLICGI